MLLQTTNSLAIILILGIECLQTGLQRYLNYTSSITQQLLKISYQYKYNNFIIKAITWTIILNTNTNKLSQFWITLAQL